MEPSSFLAHIRELQAQNRLETDRALIRENSITIRHLHKQYRLATKHRKPWYGLKLNVVFLVAVFLGMVYACIRFEKAYGWGYTVSGVIAGAVGLVLITAMIFLLMKVISPDNYKDLVQACFDSLNKLMGKGSGESKNPPTEQPAKPLPQPAPPILPTSALPAPAPQVSFENPKAQSISAAEDSEPQDG